MLTVQQTADELKIVWSFDNDVPRDPAEFTNLTAIKKSLLPQSCSYYLIGKKNPSLFEWKALVSSLQPLLESHVKVRFICTSQKIDDWLQEIGFALLGEIVLDPTAAD